MRYYYAEDNRYGSATSTGFSNTKFFMRFQNKKDRDNWVNKSNRVSRVICKRKDVIAYHGQDFYNNPEYVFAEL